jgi:hypothetical protein
MPLRGVDFCKDGLYIPCIEQQEMAMTKAPGGDFAGAWAAVAAASRGKRRVSSLNAFPGYSTDELWRDQRSPSLDDETRVKIEAEIFRRTGVRP